MNSLKADGRPQVILTCEHATHHLPAPWPGRLNIPKSVLKSHRGWDAGAAELSKALHRALPDTSPKPFLGPVSRLLVDLNRSESNPALWSPWARTLTSSERQDLLQQYYRPWREEVRRSIAQLMKQGVVIHISVHSFTPVLRGVTRKTDIGILYNPNHGMEKKLSARLIHTLRVEFPHWTIHANQPYRGKNDGHTRALRRQMGKNYLGIELEINQRLIRQNSPEKGLSGFASVIASLWPWRI
jgi:predicted N-formylglutamate amidohydrolase